MVGARRYADKGNFQRLKRVQHGYTIGNRGGQYGTINVRLAHHTAHLFTDIGVSNVHRLRNQSHAFLMAPVPAALHDLVHIIRAMIIVDERDLA